MCRPALRSPSTEPRCRPCLGLHTRHRLARLRHLARRHHLPTPPRPRREGQYAHRTPRLPRRPRSPTAEHTSELQLRGARFGTPTSHYSTAAQFVTRSVSVLSFTRKTRPSLPLLAASVASSESLCPCARQGGERELRRIASSEALQLTDTLGLVGSNAGGAGGAGGGGGGAAGASGEAGGPSGPSGPSGGGGGSGKLGRCRRWRGWGGGDDGKPKGDLRDEYERKVRDIKPQSEARLKAGESEESVARAAHQQRRDLGEQYKDLTPADKRAQIYARDQQKYETSPGQTTAIRWGLRTTTFATRANRTQTSSSPRRDPADRTSCPSYGDSHEAAARPPEPGALLSLRSGDRPATGASRNVVDEASTLCTDWRRASRRARSSSTTTARSSWSGRRKRAPSRPARRDRGVPGRPSAWKEAVRGEARRKTIHERWYADPVDPPMSDDYTSAEEETSTSRSSPPTS